MIIIIIIIISQLSMGQSQLKQIIQWLPLNDDNVNWEAN